MRQREQRFRGARIRRQRAGRRGEERKLLLPFVCVDVHARQTRVQLHDARANRMRRRRSVRGAETPAQEAGKLVFIRRSEFAVACLDDLPLTIVLDGEHVGAIEHCVCCRACERAAVELDADDVAIIPPIDGPGMQRPKQFTHDRRLLHAGALAARGAGVDRVIAKPRRSEHRGERTLIVLRAWQRRQVQNGKRRRWRDCGRLRDAGLADMHLQRVGGSHAPQLQPPG